MNNLLETYQNLEKEVYSLDGVHKSLTLKINELETNVDTNKANKELFQKCIEVLDEGFELVSTNALQSVFGDGHHLELEFDRRGAIPEAKVYIKTPDMSEPHEPEDSNAGGQKDLIALILRMVVLGFVKPEGGIILKLDEPFSQIGAGDIKQTGECLKSIVKKFDMQTILITHHKGDFLDFGDNVIEFK